MGPNTWTWKEKIFPSPSYLLFALLPEIPCWPLSSSVSSLMALTNCRIFSLKTGLCNSPCLSPQVCFPLGPRDTIKPCCHIFSYSIAWNQYKLGNQSQLPEIGTLDIQTLIDLDKFCHHMSKWSRISYAQTFSDLHFYPFPYVSCVTHKSLQVKTKYPSKADQDLETLVDLLSTLIQRTQLPEWYLLCLSYQHLLSLNLWHHPRFIFQYPFSSLTT